MTDAEELELLKERRRKTVGIRSTTFADQSTTFDNEALERRIAELERSVNGVSRTRLASTRKGV